MDNFEIIKQAIEDTTKQYLLEQQDGDLKEKTVLNTHLFAEQVEQRIESLKRQHLKFQEKDIEMLRAMKDQGGSFVKALAAALLHADSENYAKLVDTFPDYISDYKKRAQR